MLLVVAGVVRISSGITNPVTMGCEEGAGVGLDLADVGSVGAAVFSTVTSMVVGVTVNKGIMSGLQYSSSFRFTMARPWSSAGVAHTTLSGSVSKLVGPVCL